MKFDLNSEIIGKGSFATVYAVSEEECVKVSSTSSMLDEKQKALLNIMTPRYASSVHRSLANQCLAEAQYLRELSDCPNVVNCLDAYCEEEKDSSGINVYLHLERLDPLSKKSSRKTLSAKESIALGKDICKALIACREKGLIHQDIKPENIFCSADGTYKLGDFGIAVRKGRSNNITTSGGTINTLAPEVYAGSEPDYLSDLYSLGMVLYRLLNNGNDPFIRSEEEQNSAACRYRAFTARMSEEQLPAPSQADPALAAVIVKACHRDRSERYASAEEFYEALSNL